MEIIGYIASVLIGISLGLIGGGGSILTVPVLVYLFNVDAVLATYYSLFVVGGTSIVGSLSYFKKGLLSLKTAVFFGVPSVICVYLSRTFILPSIPHSIFTIGSFVLTKSFLLMILFAVLMIFASISMIKKSSINTQPSTTYNYPMVLGKGAFVGFITGLIGAGGGFLIIPALVNFLKLPMKKAIGTSLFIISINSIIGFSFSISKTDINWQLLLTITLIAIIGIIIGSFISTKIDGKKLKPAFGWFVLIMGIYIILKEIIK
jgi:uncharacterized membrane protein YfcA